MKVIDLLNMKARNEEMPTKIKIEGFGGIIEYDGFCYCLEKDYPFEWDASYFNILNREVEIIEEDKEIELLETSTDSQVLEEFKDKINEIIHKLNKMKKEDDSN